MKIIQQPSVATLKPIRKDSVSFDESENLFIEGDNLEVLKLLQKAYFGKVKMIYIDPPYNTGNEFIYPDKYTETLETYLAYTSQADEEELSASVERFLQTTFSSLRPTTHKYSNFSDACPVRGSAR
jgi:adenine specific DNA methylase Mod